MSRLDPRRYLLAKTVGWFLLSVVVISGAAAVLLGAKLNFGGDSPLLDRLGGRNAAAMLLYDELGSMPQEDWDEVLLRYGEAYSATISVGLMDGRILAGPKLTLPGRLKDKLRRSRRLPAQQGERRGLGRRIRRLMEERGVRDGISLPPMPDGMTVRFTYLGRADGGYWAGVRVPVVEGPGKRPEPGYILARSDSITGGGLFFNPLPWLLGAVGILVLSAMLWIPFVRGITLPLSRMTKAAGEIAGGRLGTRVDASRRDEIGRLGESLNVMSGRLDEYVKGQKRFLGDIAHELASPIARMELGLEILKGKVEGPEYGRVEGIAEDVRHMSALVNELLSFTRAEIGSGRITVEPVTVGPVMSDVAKRDGDGADVRIECPEGISVMGDEGLIRRALSNMLRNAVKYAGNDGPIAIRASKDGGTVTLSVTDSGPGVPQDQEARLFEPFYRTDSSRSRETGGVGLGLAIVKTCATACGGTARARNLEPRGFEVSLELRAAQ